MFSKLAVPWSTRPSTTTGDALICAYGFVSVVTFHCTAPERRFNRYRVLPTATNNASPATVGAATNAPPIFVDHRVFAVVASTACTVPAQSAKYTVESTTAGVPVTPTSPAIVHTVCKRATFRA